jgi:hypothetical protein
MNSQRSLEGYFALDHRASPGLTEELCLSQGLQKSAGKAGTIWESGTFTCSQCEKQVILNPDRSRPRYFCNRCSHFHCDECAAETVLGEPCYPFKARVQDYLELVDKGTPVSEAFNSTLILP